MPQDQLLKLLEGIGSGLGMDCSVIPSQKYPDLFVVSTTDFFYPLVEDPYMQGMIAAANVLSDMYAMGIEHVDNVLMLLATSVDMDAKSSTIVTRELIKGFDDQVKRADSQVSGGQTVRNPWPIIGGVAKSICKKEDIIMPTGALPGDLIVLTKPLGIQIAVNLMQWMRTPKWEKAKGVITEQEALRAYTLAEKSMSRLNKTGAKLMHKYKAHAATDVTGFGIMGHAMNLASNQEANVTLKIHSLPVFRGLAAVNNKVNDWGLMRGRAAETSGGLLVCLPRENAQAFIDEITLLDGQPAWIIGEVVEGNKTAVLAENPTVIEV